MREFLNAGTKAKQDERWAALQALNPRGLTYIDAALKELSFFSGRDLVNSQLNPAGKLLVSLPRALDGVKIQNSFAGSEQRESIHANANKVLYKLRGPSQERIRALELFEKLNLWDKRDLGLLTSFYFMNREYAGKLIGLLSSEDPSYLKEFIRTSRGFEGRSELVDLLLIYKSGSIRQNEMTSLFAKLMENYSLTQGRVELQQYGLSNKAVNDLMNEVIRSLHEQILAQDRKVTKSYLKADADPSLGERLLSSDQLAKYRRFLWLLKVGDCEPALRLVTGSDDRAS